MFIMICSRKGTPQKWKIILFQGIEASRVNMVKGRPTLNATGSEIFIHFRAIRKRH